MNKKLKYGKVPSKHIPANGSWICCNCGCGNKPTAESCNNCKSTKS